LRRFGLLLLCLFVACTGSHEHEDAEGDGHDHDEVGADDHDRNEADDHGDGDAAGRVTLAPQAVEAARIETQVAVLGQVDAEVTLPGRITLDPQKEAMVSAWIGGQVDSIRVRTGDVVRRGGRLGSVQSPELGVAIAAFRGALAQDMAADARLERLRALVADGVASRSQVLEAEADHAEAEGALEAAEERLRILGVDPSVGDPAKGEHYVSRVRVRSPIAGTVLSTAAKIGRQVAPGDMLFHVGDLTEVWLMVDVFEGSLALVQPGQAVRFTVPAWPGETFEGRVDQVGSWVEPDSRTVEVRVVVDNADARLMPNMFASATLATGSSSRAEGVVLPVDAVQEIEGESVVFIRTAPGEFVLREVAVAERASSTVRLSSGVSAGETVVTQGAFALKSELEKGELGHGHAH